jgi:hypothetical protein
VPDVSCVLVSAVRELSKSESILGSAAFATRLVCGPEVPSGTVFPVLWVVEGVL